MLCRVTKVSSTANNKVLFKIRIFPDNLHPVLNYITIYWYRVRPVAGPDGSSRTLVDARSWRNLGGDRGVRACVVLLLLVRLFQELLSRRCVRASSLRGRACGQKRLRARSDSAAAPRNARSTVATSASWVTSTARPWRRARDFSSRTRSRWAAATDPGIGDATLEPSCHRHVLNVMPCSAE